MHSVDYGPCLTDIEEAAELLQKHYFGGGTVDALTATKLFQRFRISHTQRMEDGTLPFLSIMGLSPGLRMLRGIGMHAIERYDALLANQIFGWFFLSEGYWDNVATSLLLLPAGTHKQQACVCTGTVHRPSDGRTYTSTHEHSGRAAVR